MNVSMAALIRLSLLLAGLALAAQADLIVLHDGHEYEGLLVQTTPAEIVFRREGRDQEEHYARADVVHVRIQERREWGEFTRAEQITDPLFAAVAKLPLTPAAYPGAAAVTLYQLDTVSLRTPQTWVHDQRALFAILKEDGDRVSVRQLEFRKDVESATILHGIAVRPDGTVLHLKDTAVQEESLYPDIPRYDTMVRRRFALPEGKAGNRFDVSVRDVRDKPLPDDFFYREFFFGQEDPAREITVEISAPVGCALRWQVLNDAAGEVVHTEERTAEGVRHRWTRRDAPLFFPEPMMPPLADCVPRLVVSAFPGSWADAAARVAAALAECEKQYPALPPPPATRNDRTVWDALWEYVSRNVQDAGIPPEATGYRPGPPAETLNLRRAPQLDRTYLLYRWLQAAGIGEVQWVWLRPRGDGNAAPDVPSLGAFALPALCIHADKGAPLFLLPGGDLDAPGEPLLPFVGAACLLPGKGLSQVPALPPDIIPGIDQTIRVDFDGEGNATVKHEVRYRGSAAQELRVWRRLTREEIQNRIEGEVHAIDARATDIRHRVEGDITSNDGALALVLDYAIPGLADRRPTLTSAKLPWLAFDARVVGRSERRLPLYWDTPQRDTITLDIGAPGGLALYAGADVTRLVTGVAQFATTLKHEDNGRTLYTLEYSRRVTEAPATAYAELKACLEKRASIARQYWIWRQPARRAPPASRGKSPPDLILR